MADPSAQDIQTLIQLTDYDEVRNMTDAERVDALNTAIAILDKYVLEKYVFEALWTGTLPALQAFRQNPSATPPQLVNTLLVELSEVVYRLVPPLEPKTPTGRNPTLELKLALKTGDFAKMKSLIEEGADVNVSTGYSTPLTVAVGKNNFEMVQYLIGKGANPNVFFEQDTNIWLSVLGAYSEASEQLIFFLIAHGLDVNAKLRERYKTYLTPLYLAIQEHKPFSIVKAIVEAGGKIEQPSPNKDHPLTLALHIAPKEVGLYLISKAPDVNVTNLDGMTPLVSFIDDRVLDMEVATALIAKGADVNREVDGFSPLMWTMIGAIDAIDSDESESITTEYVPFVNLLISSGANKQWKDSRGLTAFDYAPSVSTELLTLLAPEELPKWEGVAKSDLIKFQTLTQTANTWLDVSMCPFCLAYIERIDACKYMHHDCSPGLRHERLYRLHGPDDQSGTRYWCTICGRHCLGHRHFKRSSGTGIHPSRLVPVQVGQAQLFDPDCKPEGGGGVQEKMGRIQAMIDAAAEFQSLIGVASATQVRRMIIERAWKSDPSDATAVTIPESMAEEPSVASGELPDVPRPPEDADLLPTNEGSGKVCATNLGEPHEDNRPVFRFKHRLPNGTVYTHSDDELECYIDMIYGISSNMFEEKGKCIICEARVHPDEFKAIKDGSPEQEAWYQQYRKKYNEYNKVGGRQRGGASIPLLTDLEDAVCEIRKKKGGRRTYRRRVQRTQKRRTLSRRFHK